MIRHKHALIFLCSLALCAFGTSCSKKDDKGKTTKAKKGAKKGKAGKAGKTADPKLGGKLVEAGTKTIVSVDVGALTSCAMFKDGTVRCWGGNLRGALGVGKTADEFLESYVPVEVAGAKGAKKLWAGSSYCWSGNYSEGDADTVCTQDKGGTTKCWGHNERMYGDGEYKRSNSPIAVPLKGVVHLDSHCGTACVVNADKTASCWGSGVFGQVGHGKTDSPKRPTKVSDMTGAAEVGCGQNHCCARKDDGTVACWGYLPGGKVNVPKTIDGFKDATNLAVMQSGACALDKAGAVSCWGGGFDNKAAHVVAAADGSVDIDAEHNMACAVKKDKTVVCWGRNTFGQLGDGTKKDSKTRPVQVKGLTNAVKVAVGRDHACAVTSDNTVVCWGRNSRGQLGDGTITDRPAPVEVKGLTAKTLAKAGKRPLALPSDNKIFKPDGTPPKACAKQTSILVHVNGKPQPFIARNAKIKGSWTAKLGGATGYRVEFQNYDDPDVRWKPMARGGQLMVKFGLEHWVLEKNKEGKERPVAKPLDVKGVYTPNWKGEFRTTNSAGVYDRQKQHSFNDGQIKLTHLSKSWVCGDIDLSHKKKKNSIKGSFALRVPVKKAK